MSMFSAKRFAAEDDALVLEDDSVLPYVMKKENAIIRSSL